MTRSRIPLFFASAILIAAGAQAAPLKVASLHPILGDLARKVGGDRVTVIDLMKPGADLHHFEPTARDLAEARGATIVIASGKGIEPYLDKLQDSMGPQVKIVNLGEAASSLKISNGKDPFLCCPPQMENAVDPHWWHSSDNMKRAARTLAEEFTKADPAGKADYAKNAAAAEKHLDELKRWAQQQFTAIPKADRMIVTSHTALGYFCKEFGFKLVPVLGLAREDVAAPQYLSEAIKIIRENHMPAVFPEDQANPKVMKEIVRESGAKVAGELIADGTAPEAHTYETILRHNVAALVAALKP